MMIPNIVKNKIWTCEDSAVATEDPYFSAPQFNFLALELAGDKCANGQVAKLAYMIPAHLNQTHFAIGP